MARQSPKVWIVKSEDKGKALSESIRMLEDLTRLISDWVWEADKGARLNYVSNKIYDSLGFLAEEAVGKKLSQIGVFRSPSGEPYDPDFHLPFREVRFIAENRAGESREILVSGVPVFDEDSGEYLGTRGIARDVTEERRTKAVSEQFAAAIEKAAGFVCLYDSEDRFVLANRSFIEFNRAVADALVPGITFREFLEQLVTKNLVPDAVGREEEWISYRLYLHRNPHGPFEIHRQGGRVIELREERLSDGSTATFGADITHLKTIEGSLRDAAERNRTFTMNVAHQLRTPLAVLRSNIDNLDNQAITGSLKRDVDAISRMVEQLLDATRLETLEYTESDRVDLVELCQDVVSGLAPAAIKENRDMELLAPDDRVIVAGHADALAIAIRNLVENAMAYSPLEAPVSIEVTETPSVRVIDQGPGIPPGVRDVILKHDLRSDRRGGESGVGLVIVGRVAVQHGIRVEIEDGEDGGTVFELAFPASQRTAAD